MKKQTEKMTISEYQEKYTFEQTNKKSALYLKLIISAICIVVLASMFSLFKSVYDVNKYAGYAVGVLCIIAFIFLIIVPIAKIVGAQKFEINVTPESLARAKKHNARVRKNLAEGIVSLHTKTTSDERWYTDEKVLALQNSLADDALLMQVLNDVYATDVKKKGRDLIFKSALKAGLFSAVSQSGLTDSLVVGVVNLQMVKNIVFLYGFRPSDKKLNKIFAKVLGASFLAYGLGDIKIGANFATSLMGSTVKGIPLLGNAISAVVDSSVQGLANAVLTAVIGNNVIKYLVEEYKLQNVIEGIEVPTKEDFNSVCNELKTQLIKGKTKKDVTA